MIGSGLLILILLWEAKIRNLNPGPEAERHKVWGAQTNRGRREGEGDEGGGGEGEGEGERVARGGKEVLRRIETRRQLSEGFRKGGEGRRGGN